MITCETIQPRLTAYLDGELADDSGSEVRGHLRECAACRQVARDEAALRDGLRTLPPVDPPASLWAGVQAQLAAAEVADAHRPPWRRALARITPSWQRWLPSLPQLAVGSMLAAAAVITLSVRAHRADDAAPSPAPIAVRHPAPPATPIDPATIDPATIAPSPGDVTAELGAEPARLTASYEQAIDELAKLADDARSAWSAEHQTAFDVQVASLRAAIGKADSPRGQQRAARALIRYLQGAVVRDEVMLASGGAR